MRCENAESFDYLTGLRYGMEDIARREYDLDGFSRWRDGWDGPAARPMVEGYADAPDDSGEA